MQTHLRAAMALALAACASPSPGAMSPPACALSEADRAWLDRAVDAWRFTSSEITGLGQTPGFKAVIFDGQCTLESSDALAGARGDPVTWQATPHTGVVALPNGQEMPVAVASATISAERVTFFVMSAPSIWRAAGIDRGGPVALEDTMIAVLLHEASHVAQSGPYRSRIEALFQQYNLPDTFDDDSLQRHFRGNAEFTGSITRETELYFAAAAAESESSARQLAREARALMRARQARWETGDLAYFIEAEDIWLTLEGSGQWAGYQWLTHPAGGGVSAEDAMVGFRRGGGWWSQSQGFALALAVDRIVGSRWRRHVFGDGAHTLLELLDQAIAE